MEKGSSEHIDHSSIYNGFKEHLEKNKRVLFTAPFGSGKSTFLKMFFEDYANDYLYLNLYPIDYSISVNENVFELIKYDLVCELLNRYADKIELKKDEASFYRRRNYKQSRHKQ